AVFQIPLGMESSYRGNVDLIENKALVYGDAVDPPPSIEEVPAAMADEVARLRETLIEQIAENDEALLERYLEGETLTATELRTGLRRACLEGKLIPVMCGSALKNKGVQPLLDSVVQFLPSPLDVPPVTGTNPRTGQEEERPADDGAPFSALAFK